MAMAGARGSDNTSGSLALMACLWHHGAHLGRARPCNIPKGGGCTYQLIEDIIHHNGDNSVASCKFMIYPI